MKKAMVVVLLAMAAPAFAGNLDLADAIPWKAVTWGGFATVADQGNGVFNLSIPANGGSAGIFWRLPAYPSELISICGCWSGDTGDAGWAEAAAGVAVSSLTVHTLWPVPEGAIRAALEGVRRVVVPELNLGQYRLEVERVVQDFVEVRGVNRVDGELITADQILEEVAA